MKTEFIKRKYGRYKGLIRLIIIFLLFSNLAILILFHDGNLRYNFLRLTAETQNIYTEYMLFREIEQRRFAQGVILLSAQADKIQRVSDGNNQLLDQLLNNMKYAFSKTVDEEDRDHFEPLLRELVSIYPNIYAFRTMYAKTLENNVSEEIYEQIDSAIRLVGSAPEAYRIGARFAFMNENLAKLKEYCEGYSFNQQGGIKFNEIPYAFFGTGLRSLVLEIGDSDEKIFIRNNGLDVSKKTNYEFSLPRLINLEESINLHIASFKGVSIELDQLMLFRDGKLIKSILKDDISILTDRSFINFDGSIIIISDEVPEIIKITFPNENFIEVDKISIDLAIKKLQLIGPDIC